MHDTQDIDRTVSQEPWFKEFLARGGSPKAADKAKVWTRAARKSPPVRMRDGEPLVPTPEAADVVLLAARRAAQESRCRGRDGIPFAKASAYRTPGDCEGVILLSSDAKRAGALRAFVVDTGASRNMIGMNHLTAAEKGGCADWSHLYI